MLVGIVKPIQPRLLLPLASCIRRTPEAPLLHRQHRLANTSATVQNAEMLLRGGGISDWANGGTVSTLHMTLRNNTRLLRLSADTRWQRAGESRDPRIRSWRDAPFAC